MFFIAGNTKKLIGNETRKINKNGFMVNAEIKVFKLYIKVEFAGKYTGKASNVYLYYMPESKFWNEGLRAKIEF